jgi:hypothetical protein
VGHATGQVAISQRNRERNSEADEQITAIEAEADTEEVAPEQQDEDLAAGKIRVTSYQTNSRFEIRR